MPTSIQCVYILGLFYSIFLSLFSLKFRDHFFDTSERCRTKATKKSTVISSPGKPAKRECGVCEFHKNRESKLLANTRGGMRDIPISRGSVLDLASNE